MKYEKEIKAIFDAIDSSGFESESYYNKCTTKKAKARFLLKRFESEYAWWVKKVGIHTALTDWLQGLAINIPFYNVDILEKFAPPGLSEKKEDEFLEKYWPFMAMRILGVWREYCPVELNNFERKVK